MQKKQFTGVDKNGSAMVKYNHFRKQFNRAKQSKGCDAKLQGL